MSTSTIGINVTAQKATLAVLLTAVVDGLRTELAGVDPIVLDGSRYAHTELVARFQAALDAIAAVKTARTALSQAVLAQRAAVAQAMRLRSGVKRYLQNNFGPQNPKLQVFGFTPARIAKTTVKTKAQAKVKAAATRVARGTKGRKQRAQIKGDSTVAPSSGGAAVKAPETAKAASSSAS